MKIADKIVGNILGNPRKRGGHKDWDGDGVPNKKDCQPRNTMRQDFGPGDRVLTNDGYKGTVQGKMGKGLHWVQLDLDDKPHLFSPGDLRKL